MLNLCWIQNKPMNNNENKSAPTLKDRALDLLDATVLKALDKFVRWAYINPERRDIDDYKHNDFILPGRYQEEDTD